MNMPTLEEVKEILYKDYPHATYEDGIKSVYWIMRNYIKKKEGEKCPTHTN